MTAPSEASRAVAAAAAAARHDWRQHVANCATCANARHRRNRPRCPDGHELHEALRVAEQDLATQREADRGPLPGQAELPLGLPGQASDWPGPVNPEPDRRPWRLLP
jgi:hypothetical protein